MLYFVAHEKHNLRGKLNSESGEYTCGGVVDMLHNQTLQY